MSKAKWYARPVCVLVSLALVFGFILMPATSSMVGAQTTTGSFTTGVLPSVVLDYVPASVNPTGWLNVSVNVSNADRNLTELDNLIFGFWYDSDGGITSESEFNSDNFSLSPQGGGEIYWSPVGGFLLIDVTNNGQDTSWNSTCTEPGDLDVTWGVFWFNVTIGKVAQMTNASIGDCWQIAALVNSISYKTGFDSDPDGVTMGFYGEVNIAATSVNWSIVPAGLDFPDDGANQSAGTVTYIVNCNYTQNVSSSANWTNQTPIPAGNATLDDTGACSFAQNFSLKANVTTTLPADKLVRSGTGVIIDNGTITGDGTADGGSGNAEIDNTLWLKLAADFETSTYNGTITYSAASTIS